MPRTLWLCRSKRFKVLPLFLYSLTLRLRMSPTREQCNKKAVTVTGTAYYSLALYTARIGGLTKEARANVAPSETSAPLY